MHSTIFAVVADKIEGKLGDNRVESNDYDENQWGSFADYIGDEGVDFNDAVRRLGKFFAEYDPNVKIVFDPTGADNPDDGKPPYIILTAKALEGYLRARFAEYNANKDLTFEEFSGNSDIRKFRVRTALDDDGSYHIDEYAETGLVSLDEWVRYRYKTLIDAKQTEMRVYVTGAIDYHY